MAKIRFGKQELPGGIRTLQRHGSINHSGIDHVVSANADTIVGRGPEDYCHSVVESILENRDVNFVIPEYWDQFWNHRIGAIWHPDQELMSSGNTVVDWLKSENLRESSTTAGDVDSWTSFTGSTIVAANPAPNYVNTDTANNRFPYADFVPSSADLLYYPNANIPTGFSVDANHDFCMAMFFSLPSSNSSKTLFQINSTGTTGHFRVEHDSTSSTNAIKVVIGSSTQPLDVSSSFIYDDVNLVVAGRINNRAFTRVNGNNTQDASSVGNAISPGSVDITLGNGFSGGFSLFGPNINIYEFAFLKADSQNDSSFLEDIKKLEGGLMFKFDIVDKLPDDHIYKSHPPRQITL
tara:strand:+ start:886 stop:1938 length:1053 start_codon:yes stop_codon:yes gene_type:complete